MCFFFALSLHIIHFILFFLLLNATDNAADDANHDADDDDDIFPAPPHVALPDVIKKISHPIPKGAIYVVDELDYERRQTYELLIRATDSVSGVSAEVPVSVLVQDVNDCPPEIEQDSYNITVSERAPFGTAILKVQAKDNDTGKSHPCDSRKDVPCPAHLHLPESFV